MCFAWGRGVATNDDKVVHWLRHGAETLHHIPCLIKWTLCHQWGLFGIPLDAFTTIRLYRRIVELQGGEKNADSETLYQLYQCTGDRSYCELAMKKGHGDAHEEASGWYRYTNEDELYRLLHVGCSHGSVRCMRELIKRWRTSEDEVIKKKRWSLVLQCASSDDQQSVCEVVREYVKENRYQEALVWVQRIRDVQKDPFTFKGNRDMCLSIQDKTKEIEEYLFKFLNHLS